MTPCDGSLSLFHPLIGAWFREQVGAPTDVQAAAWPKIAAGEHVLVTAPTGSGKTLTAFLWAINQLVTGTYPTGRCSVLYVSPLRALNNDIQRNLLTPLSEIKRIFEKHGLAFPDLRVLTRSGDTPSEERVRMQRRPPEVLITTPESLNLLLSSRGGLSMLGALKTVVLDEIHSVISSKRGVHLLTAVERLVRLSGEFQRIALSATIRPMNLVAAFVGGYERVGDTHYQPRRVVPICSEGRKAYQVRVRFPAREAEQPSPESVWHPIVQECKALIWRNRSTLLFTNSRRLAENLAWRINADEEELLAYSHHGAPSREIRTEVERNLKDGKLKAIVATSSLELGIDIGSLDEVVLIQSPSGIASAIQRIGRAGHQVGEVSRATLFPTHAQDLLAAAVLARHIPKHNIEAARTIRCPLDVLAQVVISMTGVETWDLDELFAELKRSYPFHELAREQFDLVLAMLAGKYADTRIRELKARVSIDRIDNTVAARPGALQELYMSGGMIPDRGYFHLRHLETNALIGELDEEFVWEASIGRTLTIGTQNWRIERITHNDVLVLPTSPKATEAPFWRGEDLDRDYHFSEQIAFFLEEANARLEDPSFQACLRKEHCLDDAAATELVDYLEHQRESCGCDLPHRHHLLVEHVAGGPDGYPGSQIVLHTFWGGKVNRPFALALAAAWEERFGEPAEVYAADNAVYLLMTGEVESTELLSLVGSARLDSLLRKKLEGSGFFGARFRECAGRALLLTRRRMGERMPLWVSRLRSKKLLESVFDYADFPILLEAWRTCLQDEFDMEALRTLLVGLESGAVQWSEVRHEYPSPFAQATSWRQINQYMYADDTPTGRTLSKLRAGLLQEVVFSPGLRPALDPALAARFVEKRQRLAPGYSPQSPRDLLDWVKERLLIPLPEWRQLLDAIERDHGLREEELLRENVGRLVQLWPVGAATPLVAGVECCPRLRVLWDGAVNTLVAPSVSTKDPCLQPPVPEGLRDKSPAVDPWVGGPEEHGSPVGTPESLNDDEALTGLLSEWLRFYGPVNPVFIEETLGLPRNCLAPALEDLLDTQKVIQGQLLRDGPHDDVSDSENFETLLRMARADAVPSFEPLPCEDLPQFLAQHQGLCEPGENLDDLWKRLEQLSGYEAKAELWETVLVPARMRQYDPAWLDSLMQEGRLLWIGLEGRKVSFCLEEDLPLLRDGTLGAPTVAHASSLERQAGVPALREVDRLLDLFPDVHARYPLHALAAKSQQRMDELVARLWGGVWSGLISNDSLTVLRQGILSNFQPPRLSEMSARSRRRGRRSLGRTGFKRWANAVPFSGDWYRVPEPVASEDALEEEEHAKDRVRLLLDRYGVLFKELLKWEAPPFHWPKVFRALRLMELSGEVAGGCFFHGIPGLQFVSHEAFRLLQRKLPKQAVWWVNACDPGSCCGLPLETFRGRLPRRLPGNYIVYRGNEPVATVLRGGKELHFNVPPDDAHFQEYFGPLHNLLERRFQPVRHLTVETINGEEATQSPYLDPLSLSFEVVRDYGRVFLSKRLR